MSGPKEGQAFLRRVYPNGHSSVLSLPRELAIPPETPAKIIVNRVGKDGVEELTIQFGHIEFPRVLAWFLLSALAGSWVGAWLVVV